MSNLVRDNKVLVRKVLRDIKKWLSYSEIRLYGRDVNTYFQTEVFKMNSMFHWFPRVFVNTFPDDSFIIIDDKDKVLIGVDFDKIPYNNLYILKILGVIL